MKIKSASINPWIGIRVENAFLTFEELQARFFRALNTLSCFECIMLSREIGAGYRTIRRWRDMLILPKDTYLIFETIKWVENGKPVKKIDDEEFIPWLN